MSGFSGFPKEAVEFLDELEINNERTWFQAHKDVYERACRRPMEALLAELEPDFGPGKLFRINRDTRFSADKTLYKTYVAASLEQGYLSLTTEGLYVAIGRYMLQGPPLARFRAAIADDASGPQLERILADIEAKSYELWSHEKLRTAPKGYQKDHPRIELLRHKDLGMGKQFGAPAWLSTRKALDKIRTVLTDGRPLEEWFRKYVGA